MIIRNPVIEVNDVNLSDRVREVEVVCQAADIESTASGAGGTEREVGLRDDAFNITFKQSFEAANVDATLWPLFDGETPFEVKVRATDANIGATNPSWEGTCVITEYPPYSGAIGALAESQVSFPVNGRITRNVTPT